MGVKPQEQPQLRGAGVLLAVADAKNHPQPCHGPSPMLCLPPSIHLPFMSLQRRDSPAPGEAPWREERAEQGPADRQGRNLPSSGTDTNLLPHGNGRFGRVRHAAVSLSQSQLPGLQTLPGNYRAEMKLPPAPLPHTGLHKGYFSSRHV